SGARRCSDRVRGVARSARWRVDRPNDVRYRAVEGEDLAGPTIAARSGDDDDRVPAQPTEADAAAGDRAPFERPQFKVAAQMTTVIGEHDGDLHLVLADAAGNIMIAEAPRSSCNSGATAFR